MAAYIHGMSHTPIYQVWANMLQRCENKNNPEYKRYGARGIKVCERWHTFQYFYEDVGGQPVGMTFDRIDNNGNYEPSNWRWATPLQQGGNRRDNILLTLNGETLPLNQWKLRLRLDSATVLKRLKAGLSVEDTLTKGPLGRLTEHQETQLKDMILQGIPYKYLIIKFGLTKASISRRATQYRGSLTQEQSIQRQLKARGKT